MSLIELISWINFIIFNLSLFLTFFLYILSVIPSIREERVGEKAWKQCNIFKIFSDILFIILLITIVMWIWFPISMFDWKILENYIILIVISFLIAIPCLYILIRALKDAGKETVETSKKTKMYGGIYKYIRHPQILGSLLLFIILCLLSNSLFLLIWLTSLMIIITPIVIYFEENDLIKRFGERYLVYRKNTGAIIPKFIKKNIS